MWGINNYILLHDIICYCMWCTQHTVAIEHHRDSDVKETMQHRESKFKVVHVGLRLMYRLASIATCTYITYRLVTIGVLGLVTSPTPVYGVGCSEM